ncbi:MAG: hypothetical protein U0670_18590 [Anaerolineae bacterium]
MVISTLVCMFLLFMAAFLTLLLTGETVRAVILRVNTLRDNRTMHQPTQRTA